MAVNINKEKKGGNKLEENKNKKNEEEKKEDNMNSMDTLPEDEFEEISETQVIQSEEEIQINKKSDWIIPSKNKQKKKSEEASQE